MDSEGVVLYSFDIRFSRKNTIDNSVKYLAENNSVADRATFEKVCFNETKKKQQM